MKGNLSKLRERVKSGQVKSSGERKRTITRRGKPSAVLGPATAEKPVVKKVIEDFKTFAKGRSLRGMPLPDP